MQYFYLVTLLFAYLAVPLQSQKDRQRSRKTDPVIQKASSVSTYRDLSIVEKEPEMVRLDAWNMLC